MTEIDLAEFNSREAAKFSYDGLLQARQRAHQLLLLLLGGGAGLGALGLERWGTSPALAGAALAASGLWFGLVALVAWRGLESAPITPWPSSTIPLQLENWKKYSAELVSEGKPPIDPVESVRWRVVNHNLEAAEGYRAASTPAYQVQDLVFRLIWCTPLVSAVAAFFATQ